MRLNAPRIEPLADHELSAEQHELLFKGDRKNVLNVFRTLIQHVDLYKRWIPFATHVLYKSTLPPRERELAILRIGHLCRSGYEVHQHEPIGKSAGLTDIEIAAISVGPGADNWNVIDRALLQATDELHHDSFISDATWRTLSAHFNDKQLVDLVFAVGQYTLVSMALNTFGVQIEK